MSEEQVGWTDEDDARFIYEALPDWHPAFFVDVFRAALAMRPPCPEPMLAAFVTPESSAAWGDFSRARSIFDTRLRISMTALYGRDAPDVAYVRLVETDKWVNDRVDQVPASVHVTLVWRPEASAVVPGSSWRIHHMGEPIDPTCVPRTAAGFDPRTQH